MVLNVSVTCCSRTGFSLACAVKLYAVDAVCLKQAVKNNKQMATCHGNLLREASRELLIIKEGEHF